jgi:hypothetical protein
MNQVLPLAKVYKTGCLTRIFGNSGILKSEHFLKNPHCTIDYAHRQGRTGTFPKTHPQVEYGFETKVIEHSAMPCFLRAMPGKEVVNGGGAQRVRHQCPGRRDEPVDYDGTPMVGAGQDAPCDAPDFEPAHFGQGIQTVSGIRTVYVDSLLYDRTLFFQGTFIDSRPPAHHLIHGDPRQGYAKGG